MKAALIFILVIAGASSASHAQMKAEDLLRECQARGHANELGQFVCTGYFLGALDTWTMASFLAKRQFYCPPKDGISAEQAIRIYEKWISEHPADMHQPARLATFLAMREAFPCASSE
ncbi:MAG: hypothetical protein GEU87_10605 [Alphaproteobacteria bacterium]|nr:hypothetical protein [Alphaproteobacteria bacterium]